MTFANMNFKKSNKIDLHVGPSVTKRNLHEPWWEYEMQIEKQMRKIIFFSHCSVMVVG